MHFDDYQRQACRTRNFTLTENEEKAAYALGLAGEAGAVVDYLKKVLFPGHIGNREILKRELGDCLWYIAALANKYDILMSSVAETNIAKLSARYAEGFTSKDSQERKDV